MRILLTNDDGVIAPGLGAAEDIATELAGPDGEVWIVAPESEQSGVSHCVSYTRPMRLNPIGLRRYAVDGSPADCVIAALHHIMLDAPPDLIISGVNRGHNVAEDTVYSGTVGGAIEGVLHGVRSIALSQYYGPENIALADTFEAARKHGVATIRKLLAAPWGDGDPYGLFYNVNFPPVPAKGVKGVRATVQGRRVGGAFRVQPTQAPNGRTYFWLSHGKGNKESSPGHDAHECAEGWITVTPMRADLTASDQMDALARALD